MRKSTVKLLCAALLLCLTVPASAAGSARVELDLALGSITIEEVANGIQYTQNGTSVVSTGGCFIKQTGGGATANTITVNSGDVDMWISGINIELPSGSPIQIDTKSAVTLNLFNSNFCKALCATTVPPANNAGILVLKGATLTIEGNGTLYAYGGQFGAGIGGGGHNGGTGHIVVESGNIIAFGGANGSGIGNGKNGSGASITINGGSVSATGGEFGAGLGGGDGGWDDISVTINDGVVESYGGTNAAGIGTGSLSSGKPIVTITGGAVTALGDSSFGAFGGGAGIGGGASSYVLGDNGGLISISGGTVTVSGGSADIGGGSDIERHVYSCDQIAISPYASVTAVNGKFYEKITPVHPISVYAQMSNTATLSATGSYGFSGLTYQWQVSTDSGSSWTDLAGETTETLAVVVDDATLNNRYRCVLTNGFNNTLATNAARVYEFSYTTQPCAATVNKGEAAVLSAETNCPEALYQWQRSLDGGATWNDLAGKDTSTVLLSSTLPADTGLYRCAATAPNGDILYSDTAQLTVTNNANSYKVEYLLEQLDGSYAPADQAITEAEAGTPVTAEIKTFPGFTLDENASTLSGTAQAGSALVLKLYYTRDNGTITFVSNGGSAAAPITAKHGTPVTAPTEPVWFGHDFGGWYSDPELTEPYAFGVMPVGGATVYAKWTAVNSQGRSGDEYTVGGIVLRDPISYEPLDRFPQGKFIAEVSVRNNSAVYPDAILVATYTAQGQFIGLQYVYSNTAAGSTLVFGVTVDNSDGKVGQITVMVAPALNNTAQPLAKSFTLK